MSQYERRVSLAVGVLFLALFAGALWVTLTGSGDPDSLLTEVVGGIAVLFAGVAFVVAGLREQVTVAGRTLEWWQTQCVGAVFLGLYMTVPRLAEGSVSSGFEFLGLVAGIATVGVAIHRLRNGRPEEAEPSTRQVATVVVGTMAVFLLLMVFIAFS